MADIIANIIAETRAYACLDCGKCTAACPVAGYDPEFSPRKLVASAVGQQPEDLLHNKLLWECISCARCQEHCHSGVDFTGFIKALREAASGLGESGECTHGGAMQALMRLMTSENISQNRLGWVGKALKTAAVSDVAFFVGCLPYHDIIFADFGVATLENARGAIKLLNRLGIVPALLPDERCCGHDLLWAGDVEGFRQLAEHNIRELEKTGAKKVVTACAEGYLTLKYEYPRHFGQLGFEVVHITQLLAEAIAEEKLNFKPVNKNLPGLGTPNGAVNGSVLATELVLTGTHRPGTGRAVSGNSIKPGIGLAAGPADSLYRLTTVGKSHRCFWSLRTTTSTPSSEPIGGRVFGR